MKKFHLRKLEIGDWDTFAATRAVQIPHVKGTVYYDFTQTFNNYNHVTMARTMGPVKKETDGREYVEIHPLTEEEKEDCVIYLKNTLYGLTADSIWEAS